MLAPGIGGTRLLLLPEALGAVGDVGDGSIGWISEFCPISEGLVKGAAGLLWKGGGGPVEGTCSGLA